MAADIVDAFYLKQVCKGCNRFTGVIGNCGIGSNNGPRLTFRGIEDHTLDMRAKFRKPRFLVSTLFGGAVMLHCIFDCGHRIM